MKKWFKSLLSAAIGAAASAVPLVIVAPETFNLAEGWQKLLTMMAINAILAVALYLKQSPLPE